LLHKVESTANYFEQNTLYTSLIHGKNGYAEESKNLARFENNFVRLSK